MQLVVPAVPETDFLDTIGDLPIDHLYGAQAGDRGLRANPWLPQPDEAELTSYVERARDLGMPYFYCLNVACLGNREFTPDGQRWLVERLGWIQDAGCEGVVLSNPYLVAFAKRRFPDLRVAVSTAASIDGVDKALFFEDQGADVLYLPEYINRDLPLLRQICKRTRSEVVLLANVGCLASCPIRQYHVNLVSHSNEGVELGTYVDYPLMWCTQEKIRHPGSMLKSPWIRPEDLGLYEEIGIDTFKLAGREMDRAWIERGVRAYAARRYDGELNDLILGFHELEPYATNPVRIPNRSLDGFVEFFRKKHDCRVGCRDCRYCDDWAERIAEVREDRPRVLRHLGRAIERFESGEFRTLER